MEILNWEILVAIVTVIATILGGVWFIVNKAFGLGKFANRIDELDKRTCHAACDIHEKDINIVKDDLKSINENITSVKSTLAGHEKDINIVKDDLKTVKCDLRATSESVSKITALLTLKDKDADKLFSIKHSPRQLNETGKQIFADIKGAEFLEANKDFLFSEMTQSYKPKTALDVENAAHAVCMISSDNDIFNELKNFVYNSPSYEVTDAEGRKRLYDLTMPDICFILSLPLRDMYLKAHPEIAH